MLLTSSFPYKILQEKSREKQRTQKQNTKLKQYIHMLFSGLGRSVLGKTVPEVLSTARGRRPRAVLKTVIKTLFIFFSGKLLYKKYLCCFFTEAVSHRARAFDVTVKQTRVVYRST